MLREIPNVRQVPGEATRRWFFSHEQDLLVWFDADGTPIGFQLAYGKYQKERALRWKAGAGFLHQAVDDGESTALRREAPILVADGYFDAIAILERFMELSTEIPKQIVDFVSDKLKEHPNFEQTTKP
jgi:hypothetical protein